MSCAWHPSDLRQKGAHKVELEKQMQTLIEQLDEDGSGTLNLEEYEKRESPQKQAEIVQLIQQQGQLRLAQNSTEEMPEARGFDKGQLEFSHTKAYKG